MRQNNYPPVKHKWSEEEADKLVSLLKEFGVGKWKQILEAGKDVFHPSRTSTGIRDKWRNILKAEKRKLGNQNTLIPLTGQNEQLVRGVTPNNNNNEEEAVQVNNNENESDNARRSKLPSPDLQQNILAQTTNVDPSHRGRRRHDSHSPSNRDVSPIYGNPIDRDFFNSVVKNVNRNERRERRHRSSEQRDLEKDFDRVERREKRISEHKASRLERKNREHTKRRSKERRKKNRSTSHKRDRSLSHNNKNRRSSRDDHDRNKTYHYSSKRRREFESDESLESSSSGPQIIDRISENSSFEKSFDDHRHNKRSEWERRRQERRN